MVSFQTVKAIWSWLKITLGIVVFVLFLWVVTANIQFKLTTGLWLWQL